VRNAFVALDCDVAILNRPHQITGASHLVLPGVGAFGDAMEALIHRDWVPAMNAAVLEKGMPLLGICLGLQLLATRSNEYGSHDGFGWIPGQVVRLSGGEGRYRVPHVGWNDVAPPENHKSADEAGVSGVFYFVHSYH